MSEHKNHNLIKVALFGAAPDTPNMGVSALFHSTLSGIQKHIPNVEFTVFDNGIGRRTGRIEGADGITLTYNRCGARIGRRYHRPENLETMNAFSHFGSLGKLANKNLRTISESNAVLDVSGGDSFTDLYGPKRFYSVFRPKQIALNLGTPLILLPQTYGPFKDLRFRALAADVVRRAAMCWARDERSFSILKELLGDDFDTERHRCGVDLAFALSAKNARDRLSTDMQRMLDCDRVSHPLVGFNVSGLIYNAPEASRQQYGFKADYKKVVHAFLDQLLHATGSNIVLVPHVMSEPGHYESDQAACEDVSKRLPDELRDRVTVAPTLLNQNEVKWLIAQTDWFCGTRMHSTIAGLSSMAPTATVSYSDKAKGVFESCGQGQYVLDPRILDTTEVLAGLRQSFAKRDQMRRPLQDSIPSVSKAAHDQIIAIASQIQGGGSSL